jgi:pimeloyl-ACP methyl ester carboxylesterase
MRDTSAFADLRVDGRELRIEYVWIAPERAAAPLLVFLHEGLGSVAMWRDFPRALCDAGGYRGLVYSRPGYGRSTPRARAESWGPRFLEFQATEILPRLFEALGIDPAAERPWLFGHSDGGSIALIHAARFPGIAAGLVVLAPHIKVEAISVASIHKVRAVFQETDLPAKLARYHDDVCSAFYGWNDVWLDPAFRDWDISATLATIACPVLAIQGTDDEYGTMAQIDGIKAVVSQTELLKLETCGHSPHRDQAEKVIAATVDFIGRYGAALL